MKFLAALISIVLASSTLATPCDEIDQTLSAARKIELAPIVARQLNSEFAEVLESFSSRGWVVLHVDIHTADEPYLFFKSDPAHNKYQMVWSGAARMNESQEIYLWTRKNARGIPWKLAKCFAWHVTAG